MKESIASLRHRLAIRLKKKKILADPAARRLHDACSAVDARRTQARPIAESRFVALDLETTGLHPYLGDEIVSVALVELRGLTFSGRRFVTLVNPEREIPPASSAIHGIVDGDIRDAPTIDSILPELIAFLGDAVVIAHHANFDLRFLNKRLYRRGASVLKNPWIDTMMLYGAWRGRPDQYALDDVARRCGVAAHGRHSALGDAEIAGEIARFLVPRLLPTPGETVGRLIACQFHGYF
uniref:DNA-directed DNA polymerase n=1 Tax=Candidatus Kentrum eta TaxID=2126337 RepID=A0A450UFB2_9GAMM|nr:MAG: exonuclease, DNA polymerase III, epsilon subunit family [Candidatus Kentron sp. H]VFJ91142.1 MAG: exonuclease, DNA polymerase III, epsilon subunit family [Candidatus Kentron sp. H]VFJ97459.1 MAG: exonuclease, DNA polymerase III, epsilon subunit family [Candidatus Kentron sp. H]